MRNLFATLALAAYTTACGLAQNSAAPQAREENWKLSGWETTTCCCNDICPCRYNEKPTHMECESIIAIHVDKGQYGKTRLDDVNFVLIGRGFDEHSKGWNKIYFDEKATPEQQKAIGGVLMSIISSYKPGVAQKIFGADSKGAKAVPMSFTKTADGLVREVNVPGVCHVKARLGKVPTSSQPMHVLGVFTEFSPVFYPAAAVDARVESPEVPFDHPVHHRAEVEDFTITREDYQSHRLGFQAYTGSGGCLLPRK